MLSWPLNQPTSMVIWHEWCYANCWIHLVFLSKKLSENYVISSLTLLFHNNIQSQQGRVFVNVTISQLGVFLVPAGSCYFLEGLLGRWTQSGTEIYIGIFSSNMYPILGFTKAHIFRFGYLTFMASIKRTFTSQHKDAHTSDLPGSSPRYCLDLLKSWSDIMLKLWKIVYHIV